jgi:hypothetical protein
VDSCGYLLGRLTERRLRTIGGKRTPKRRYIESFRRFGRETYANNHIAAIFCLALMENVRTKHVKRGCRASKPAQLLPTLHLDRLDRRGSGLRVEVAAAELDRLQIVVKLIDQRNAGRNIETYDILVAHPVQMLHDRAY